MKIKELMNISIGKVVTSHPELVSVFMDYNVDFCCGGDRTVAEAIEKDTDEVEALELAANMAIEQAKLFAVGGIQKSLDDFTNEELIDRIINTHHRYLRETLPRISELLFKILGVHGEHHPELFDIHRIFGGLRTELEGHLIKEEKQLFPQILKGGKEVAPLIKTLEDEHDGAGESLHELTDLTKHFTLPSDACATYGATYDLLKALTADMYMHVHTENNVLFKRF